jgi:hypothetical protein
MVRSLSVCALRDDSGEEDAALIGGVGYLFDVFFP